MANFNRCPRCGNIPSDGSRFCSICGLDLGVQLGMGVGNVQGGSGGNYVNQGAYARYNRVSTGVQNNYVNNGGNVKNKSSEWVSLAFGFAFPGILMLPFLIMSIIFRVKAQKELQKQQGQNGRNGLLTGAFVMNIIGIVYQAITLCAMIALFVFFLFVMLNGPYY